MKFNHLTQWLFASTTLLNSYQSTTTATNASSPISHQLRGAAGSITTQRHLKRPADATTCTGGTAIVEVEYEDNPTLLPDSYISCETSDGKSYQVTGVSASELARNKRNIIDGTADIVFPDGAQVDESTGKITLPPGRKVSFKEKSNSGNRGGNHPHHNDLFDGRHLQAGIMGSKSVLVVRVVSSDGAPTQSVERLSDSVFGNGVDGGADAVTLRSQYLDCSYDQLEFKEATDQDGANINIRNGTFAFQEVIYIYY